MSYPTLSEIVRIFLDANGYDGLFNNDDCACKTSDLFPCDEPKYDCQAGYKFPCPEDCGEHDWHIGEK